MRIAPAIAGLLAALAAADRLASAADADDPKLPSLRIVFFTPQDVSPPAGVERRLTQVARYTEDFFVKWMTRWNYEPARKQIFQWQSKDKVEVLFAQGDQRPTRSKTAAFAHG